MKKYCGKCGKETEQEEWIVEVLEDVLGKAEVCTVCDEEWVSEAELRRASRELKDRNILTIKRKLVKLGDSMAVRIPKDIARALGLKSGDVVDFYRTKDEIRIKVRSES
ncbi:MAG: AbrB/MazE/SpoVT family DNA-binding domain-containing protein [Candidatus Hydrothermarchaeaceae archaeon]